MSGYGRDEARELLQGELSHPRYREGEETVFSRLGRLVRDLFDGLLDAVFSFNHPWLLAILAVLVVGLLVWIFRVAGRPRRPQLDLPGKTAFAADDGRTAAQLLAAAQRAAETGDWQRASQEMFRAGVLTAVEAGRVRIQDGDTAHEVGTRLAALLRAAGDSSAQGDPSRAAEDFDRITFGGEQADEALYRRMAAFREACLRLRPARDEEPAEAGWARPR
ncbi:DUF4129 domain-containing protein [Sediminivirga luteola]|uniref:DUF4129 domain-containing protein n=1 Tax=Sediminivirga luteola TaxID=1774748 RepID=A0A8J2TYW6_9MICO|nr:DUF4129 domain-containing protein [Sediminivirga luteola]MCI2265611.1 DUF4129 domain-containing protein [Sediminivirga luteola]GGA18397.1 hypothetical protein GCM10011333_21800 [Sediminivirga luteola]